ncbi:MAG: helix-turn-helix domain-containing protein [Lachnospiraceae bacterium]|nr:helix-turn-helix domain-containing protein [Lachnospiraceae bacterium]
MKFDQLFEQRALVAEKLKTCIRDFGYTKVSFAGKLDISRPTLDKLLSGSIDSKSTFDKHLQKVLVVLEMTCDELLFYSSEVKTEKVEAVYSLNAPADYTMSEKAEKQYNLLMDILDLCTIYY